MIDVPVVSGIGIVSRLGVGGPRYLERLTDASAARACPADDPALSSSRPVYLRATDSGGRLDEPASGLAALATAEAIRDAGIGAVGATSLPRLILASSVADASTAEAARSRGLTPPASDFSLVSTVRERCDLQTFHGIELSNACAGSGYAIALGCDLIRSGAAAVVIAGGAEAFSRVTVAAFTAMSALSRTGLSLPFDRVRDGVVLGEGAAVVILESASHARQRGAEPYAAIGGSGWSCDAYHAMAPDPSASQITRAMSEALTRSQMVPSEIGCVIPHGTGTPHNDVVEARALRGVFGSDESVGVPLYSLKAKIGHLAGGSAAAAVAVAALGVRHGALPPNLPLTQRDPECPVELPETSNSLGGRAVLVNAFAAGGINISLTVREAAL